MICNCCRGTKFIAFNRRRNAQCANCHSLERTRAMRLVLEALDLPKAGSRVLHLAPEYSMHAWLRKRAGEGYDPADLAPSGYKWAGARKIDLTFDAARMESETYDLIIHSHVMEHIPCNITAVLFHLHRALKPDGMQICCIPFAPNRRYEEALEALPAEEATTRFGQHDHVRRIGALDADKTIGMLFTLPEYDLRHWASEATLLAHNIPPYAWTGLTPHTILVLDKNNMKLNR